MKKKSYYFISVLALLGGIVLLLLLIFSKIREMKIEEDLQIQANIVYDERKKNEDANRIQVKSNTAVKFEKNKVSAADILEDENVTVLVSPDEFCNNSRLGSSVFGKAFLSYKLEEEKVVETNDIIILEFEAYTEEGSAKLRVECGETENFVYLTKTPTVCCIPICENSSISSVFIEQISDFITITIDKMYLVNYKSQFSIEELATGYYSIDEREQVSLNAEDRLTNEGSMQCLCKDNYLYSINNGRLIVYEKKENELKEIASVNGMYSVRDMEFTSNKNAIVVTARQNGMYIVDITNSESPTIISHYDTLEATTGLCVRNNNVFLASRYFGIEIVDISDLKSPKYVNSISRDSEYRIVS